MMATVHYAKNGTRAGGFLCGDQTLGASWTAWDLAVTCDECKKLMNADEKKDAEIRQLRNLLKTVQNWLEMSGMRGSVIYKPVSDAVKGTK